MGTYRATFERIGRNHAVPPLVIVADDVDAIEDAIATYAKRIGPLGSRFFDVQVNLESGRVSIEAGRFGAGHIEETGPSPR